MFTKTLILAVLLVGVSCRHISPQYIRPARYVDENINLTEDDLEDQYSEHDFESLHPVYLNSRVRRQIHGVMNSNPDGSLNIMGKLPLAGNSNNALSAIGGLSAVKPGGGIGASSAGLAFDNVNGHGLSVTGKHIPDFGNQITGAGKLNLFHNNHNDLTANAFATRTMPNNPMIPNFNTYGGSLDYMFNNKLGASLGAAHTDVFKRTDLSAMGNVNLFRNPSSSLDFNGGVSRSMSPFMPKQSWQPSFGLSYSRFF